MCLHKGWGQGGAAPLAALSCLSHSPRRHLHHPQLGHICLPTGCTWGTGSCRSVAQMQLNWRHLVKTQTLLLQRAQHMHPAAPASLRLGAHCRVCTYPNHRLTKPYTSFLCLTPKETNIRDRFCMASASNTDEKIQPSPPRSLPNFIHFTALIQAGYMISVFSKFSNKCVMFLSRIPSSFAVLCLMGQTPTKSSSS